VAGLISATTATIGSTASGVAFDARSSSQTASPLAELGFLRCWVWLPLTSPSLKLGDQLRDEQ
jgi:hypothetical protein